MLLARDRSSLSSNDVGSAITVGIVWNSYDKKWRFQSAASIKTDLTVLESLKNLLFSEVILVEPDGRKVTYKKREDGAYQCEATNADGLSMRASLMINTAQCKIPKLILKYSRALHLYAL